MAPAIQHQQPRGDLAKWVPEIGANGDPGEQLRKLEMRAAIIDRVCGWEELQAGQQIHEATVMKLDENLAKERGPAWQVAEWQAKRALALAKIRRCELTMRQYELEVVAIHEQVRSADG